MSRVGKKPILIPTGVQVKIEGQKVTITGPKGELSREFRPEVKIEADKEKISVSPQIENKKTAALWGTTRAILNNMIKGMIDGYEKKLEIEGLGYKAALEGNDLVLSVGFTHTVKIKAPPGIKFSIEKNLITVFGIDKELVGLIASKIRKIRPAEPYKGKGIKYQGEVIRRKAGKKVVTAAGGAA